MRTLNRPMFNMGGPIKQGIMTGIREPYKNGSIVGGHQSPLLAGAHPWKDKSGREHHVIPALWAAASGLARFAPSIYRAAQTGLKAGKFGRSYNLGKIGSRGGGGGSGWSTIPRSSVGKELITTPKPGMGSRFMGGLPPWLRTSIERDPIFKGGKWIKEALMGPTAKGIGQKIVRGATTPTGALTLTYFGGRWLWPDGTEATDKEVKKELNKKKGDKDYGPFTKGAPTLTQEQRDAKARADKEKRINALLDTMGYDKARKNAAYDALMDAGRMVSERGSLRGKDIGRELIDPIVAATSQRFDKPEQIREAVGLMQTKADIQKEMTKDETALANRVKELQILTGQKTLAGDTLEETAEAFFTRHGQWPSGELLGNLARNKNIDITEVVDTSTTATGLKDIGDPVEFMEGRIKKFKEKGIEIPPGNYVVEDAIIIIDAEGNVRRR